MIMASTLQWGATRARTLILPVAACLAHGISAGGEVRLSMRVVSRSTHCCIVADVAVSTMACRTRETSSARAPTSGTVGEPMSPTAVTVSMWDGGSSDMATPSNSRSIPANQVD